MTLSKYESKLKLLLNDKIRIWPFSETFVEGNAPKNRAKWTVWLKTLSDRKGLHKDFLLKKVMVVFIQIFLLVHKEVLVRKHGNAKLRISRHYFDKLALKTRECCTSRLKKTSQIFNFQNTWLQLFYSATKSYKVCNFEILFFSKKSWV